MIAHILTSNPKYKKVFEDYFKSKKVQTVYPRSYEELFLKSMTDRPHYYIVDVGFDSSFRFLDSVKDLRLLYGTFPLVLAIGGREDSEILTHGLGVGADNFITWPFDLPVVENYLARDLGKDLFSPFKHRHVPSGGVQVRIGRTIELSEINARGIVFYSNDFMSKGTIFHLSLNDFLSEAIPEVRVRVVKASRDDDGSYNYFAKFFDIDKEIKRKIIFDLKNSSK